MNEKYENRDYKSTLLLALAYVAKHPTRHLFPLAAGKKGKPLIRDNLAQASNDPKQLRAWSQQFGPNIAWGCASKKSGLICVDIDCGPDKVGVHSFKFLRDVEGLPFPDTEVQRSPSGGYHLIYNGEHHFTASKIGKHLDTPNYFVIAGCERGDGRAYALYRDRPVVDAPAWLVERITPRADRAPREGSADAVSLDWFKRALQATPYTGGPAGLDDRRSYQGWLEFAMACHEAAGGDEGEYMWTFVEWSLDDPEAKASWSAESIERHWQSFTANPPPGDAAMTRASWLKVLSEIGQGELADELLPTAADDFATDPPDLADMEAVEALRKFHNERDAAREPELKSMRYSHKDFLAYMPEPNKFIFIPSGADEMWPGGNVNLVCKPVPMIDPKLKKEWGDHQNAKDLGGLEHGIFATDEDGEIIHVPASEAVLFNRKQRVAGMTWWPGKPAVICDTLIRDGGVVPMQGMHTFNRYRKPRLKTGGYPEPTLWLDHVKLIYPDDWQHIVHWLAWRVQHPETKVLHCLVMGGATRIGKDTILKPVSHAIGPWNFKTTNAQTIMDEPKYNGYLEAVICLINEAQDFGDDDRYAFYNRVKPWLGGTASGVLMVADKYVKAHPVVDVWGAIITTNHKVRGLYLPADDARHYVAWSNRAWEDWGYPDIETFAAKYFGPLYRWYESGGYDAVAHYLMTLPLDSFSPTAPPPKTLAWHEIVNAYSDPAKNTLTDILETLGNPPAVTVGEVSAADKAGELGWLDPRQRNLIPAQFEEAGYVHQGNPAARNGRWQVGDKRREVSIYVQAKLTPAERRRAAVGVYERERKRAKGKAAAA
jgi:Bifunctional DNA primase/polymerase, N-terminal